MAIYDIETPNGDIIQVEGPDDATEQQILDYVASQFPVRAEEAMDYVPTATGEEVGIPNNVVPPIEQPEFGAMESAIGMAQAGASTIGGGIAGTATFLASSLSEVAKQLMNGTIGERDAGRVAQERVKDALEKTSQAFAPGSEAGQYYIKKINDAARDFQDATGIEFTALAGMAPMMQQQSAMIGAGQKPFSYAKEQVATELDEALTGTKIVTTDIAGGKVNAPAALQPKARMIAENPYTAERAGLDLIDGKAVKDPLAKNILNLGFRPKSVAAIKAASAADNERMLKMLEIHKEVSSNTAKAQRMNPLDEIGDSLVKRVSLVNATRKKAGKELDSLAENDLKGTQVDFQPAVDQFVTDLQDKGVSLSINPETNRMEIGFDNAWIAAQAKDHNLIKHVVRTLLNNKPKSAYDIHKAKQFIQKQIPWGGKQTTLDFETVDILKKLQRNLNDSLRVASDDYARINDTYASAMSALEPLADVAGKKFDIDANNAGAILGQESRKLSSNYKKRNQLNELIDRTDRFAATYAPDKKFDDNINDLAAFGDELHVYFPEIKDRTFKAESGTPSILETIAAPEETLVKRGIEGISNVLRADKTQYDKQNEAYNAMADMLRSEIARKKGKQR